MTRSTRFVAWSLAAGLLVLPVRPAAADDDVIVLGEHVWAVHGYIAYDGEVIAATFATEQEARIQLSRLGGLLSMRG